jgi:DNA-binding PadR family transcriptional regulator
VAGRRAKPFDQRALLLLGVLCAQSQHGYQLNEFIERNLVRVMGMKKPTAYALLERLAREDYVSAQVEPSGRFRDRRVYSITPRGRELFLELLRGGLASGSSARPATDVAVMFLDHLPAEEAAALLRRRLRDVEAAVAAQGRAPAHGFGLGVDLAMERMLALARADERWLRSALRRLAPSREDAGGA